MAVLKARPRIRAGAKSMNEARPAAAEGPELSVVVPVYNEVENVAALAAELWPVLEATGRSFEVVLVDDGSQDGTVAALEQVVAEREGARLVALRRNFGQTAALTAGFDHARGGVIVTLDADLQNDPRDIPALLAGIEAGHDIVAGWRAERQDPFWSRRLPSQIANRIISATTGVKLHDYGCTLKAFRAEVVQRIRLYGEMHRFIPAVANWMGVSILEVPVHHRPRRAGQSKYGISRTVRVVLDLMTVKFLESYSTKPIQIFGLWGLIAGGVGTLGAGWLTVQRLFFGVSLADRPILLFFVLLIVVGVQFISMGLVAEMLARTYHESQAKPIYHVKRTLAHAGEPPLRSHRG
jgi:glycosyltransferase involved in cell wall biosynthesis